MVVFAATCGANKLTNQSGSWRMIATSKGKWRLRAPGPKAFSMRILKALLNCGISVGGVSDSVATDKDGSTKMVLLQSPAESSNVVVSQAEETCIQRNDLIRACIRLQSVTELENAVFEDVDARRDGCLGEEAIHGSTSHAMQIKACGKQSGAWDAKGV